MTATTTIRLPLSIYNHRQSAVHPLPQKNSWTLKRANPIFSVLDEKNVKLEAEADASPNKSSRTQVISWTDQVSEESTLLCFAQLYASPTKRSRTQVISWTDQVSEESSPLCFTSGVN
jgi:hypothetical protein